MTCKDCIKYDVCYMIKNIGEFKDNAETQCNSFKDKSIKEKNNLRKYNLSNSIKTKPDNIISDEI